MGLMHNKALWVTLMSGGATLTDAQSLLRNELEGLALDFTSDDRFAETGFYGDASIKDLTTSANNYNSSPTTTSSSLLTYTSPSVKMTMGPSGTLRYQAHNIAYASEDFTNAAWTKTNCTATNATTATISSTTAVHFVSMGYAAGIIQGATYKGSVRIYKTSTQPFIQLYWYVNASLFLDCTITVATGASTNRSGTCTVTDMGTYWLCEYEAASPASGALFMQAHYSQNTAAGGSYLGDGAATMVLSHWHWRRTPSDSTYLTTTGSAARYALPLEWNTSGVLQGLLVEESRTNLCQYSSMPSNWGGIAATVALNNATAPNGNTEALRMTLTGGNVSHRIYSDVITVSTATNYTLSCYVKAGTRSIGCIYADLSTEASSGFGYIGFDLSAQTVTPSVGISNASITSVGNGWFRVSGVGQSSGASVRIFGGPNTTNAAVSDDGATLFFWGAQLELGSFPTSYIHVPAASSVTRAADNVKISASAFPSLTTTGSVYISGTLQALPPASQFARLWSLDDSGASANYIAPYVRHTTGISRLAVSSGGVNQADLQDAAGTTLSAGSAFKSAAAFAANDFAYTVNGAAVGTDTSGTMPSSIVDFYIANGTSLYPPTVIIKQLVAVPRRRTNAELVIQSTP